MTIWPSKSLGDVADFYAGASLPQGVAFESQPGGFFLVKVSEMNLPGNERFIRTCREWSQIAGARSATCPAGSVLIPKRGGAISTNKKRITTRPSVLDPNLMAIHPRPEVLDLGYLFQWLQNFDLTSISSGSSVPQLNKKDLEPLLVPTPPLDEQRRVAHILDQADALRARRSEAIARLDGLSQSIYLDLFGDPIGNPKGWDIQPFRSVVSEFRYGTSNKSDTSGHPALRIPNVIGGIIDLGEVKTVPVTAAEFDRLRLMDGDMLFVRTNGNPNYVGRCAIFESKAIESAANGGADWIYASYLIRARLDRSRVRPAFAREFMLGQAGRKALLERSKTSAGQYNINIEGLATIEVPIPPIPLQERFEFQLNRIANLRRSLASHLSELNALFEALQYRAFCGKL